MSLSLCRGGCAEPSSSLGDGVVLDVQLVSSGGLAHLEVGKGIRSLGGIYELDSDSGRHLSIRCPDHGLVVKHSLTKKANYNPMSLKCSGYETTWELAVTATKFRRGHQAKTTLRLRFMYLRETSSRNRALSARRWHMALYNSSELGAKLLFDYIQEASLEAFSRRSGYEVFSTSDHEPRVPFWSSRDTTRWPFIATTEVAGGRTTSLAGQLVSLCLIPLGSHLDLHAASYPPIKVIENRELRGR